MLSTEDHDGVAVLRMEHGKVNALDADFLEALAERIAQLETSARAIVLTGQGHVFSAGADLRRVVDEDDEYRTRGLAALSRALLALFWFPKPIVAAVNGHAIAGGCVIVQACDRRIMAAGTGRIGLAELAVGVPFPSTALEIVRFTAGPRTQELVYLADTYEPSDALARGLIDAVTDPDALIERALADAERLASIPPETFQHTKRSLRGDTIERLRSHAGLTDAEAIRIWGSDPVLDSIRSTLERLGR